MKETVQLLGVVHCEISHFLLDPPITYPRTWIFAFGLSVYYLLSHLGWEVLRAVLIVRTSVPFSFNSWECQDSCHSVGN